MKIVVYDQTTHEVTHIEEDLEQCEIDETERRVCAVRVSEAAEVKFIYGDTHGFVIVDSAAAWNVGDIVPQETIDTYDPEPYEGIVLQVRRLARKAKEAYDNLAARVDQLEVDRDQAAQVLQNHAQRLAAIEARLDTIEQQITNHVTGHP